MDESNKRPRQQKFQQAWMHTQLMQGVWKMGQGLTYKWPSHKHWNSICLHVRVFIPKFKKLKEERKMMRTEMTSYQTSDLCPGQLGTSIILVGVASGEL